MPERLSKGHREGHKQLADLRVRRSLFYRCASRRRFHSAKVADFFLVSLTSLQMLQEAIALRSIQGAATALFADTVLFDLVLKGAEADAEQFGRLLAMVRDFGEGPPDRFTFDFL
jgi:hypothetical protein